MAVNDWSFLGVSLTHLVAGLLGGVARGMSRPEQSYFRRSATAVIGGLVAGYGTPVVAPVVSTLFASYGVTPEGAFGMVGFLLGLTGLSICEGFIRMARRWRDDPTLPPLP